MATAKKKPSAKRTVKYAAKTQSSARQTSAGRARPAVAASANNAQWVNSGTAEQWQKGASDWAKQSAKLYQMPFNQGDAGEAAQKAADTVKAATENMVKMSSDMVQKMFSQQAKASNSAQPSFDPATLMKQWQEQLQQTLAQAQGMFQGNGVGAMPSMPALDMGAMQEKLTAFTRDTSEQFAKASQGANRASAEAMQSGREQAETLTQVATQLTELVKTLAAELVSYHSKQFAQQVEFSKNLLTCRTLNDMFDLATRTTKANLDAFFSQSVLVSETLFQGMTDASDALNAGAAKFNQRMHKAMQG